MNDNDFSSLSYKELQALALKYRVPGNIKKKLLVKVLQAAKQGNDHEVCMLLQGYKQNRKKRVGKIKTSKLGLTSTPLHSPDYVMAEDYYGIPQQPHYQRVSTEENILVRDDDRIPHYEEFKQFLLRRIQTEFHTHDTNNNLVQDPAIVDLRTVHASSSIQTIPIDTGDYSRPNIIAVHNADSIVYQSNDHVEYQTLEDSNSNVQGPILLKKMLEAPVGANLGEIASPVLSGYRLWSVEQYQTNSLLDNSDTLTAESDNRDNEENLESNTVCYGVLTGVKGEYFLNEPTFVRNVEEIGDQISAALSNGSTNQYRYSSENVDPRQHYENWAITNTIETTDTNCVTSDPQSTKIFEAIYCDNVGPDSLNKPTHDESVTCQYRMTENTHAYTSNQNFLNLNTAEESQYYDTNIISNVPSDSPGSYYLQNLVKYTGESTGEYYRNIHSVANSNAEQDTYISNASQAYSNENHISGHHYEYPLLHDNQVSNVALSENVEQQQQQQQGSNSANENEACVNKDFLPDRVQNTNGMIESFWPTKFPKTPPSAILENILNLYSSKRVDLSRFDQTSCVYCYIAPIVTHTPVLSNFGCSQQERFVAEHRHHSFTPYWLLYNDTSSGLRMANLQGQLCENVIEKDQIPHTPNSNRNPEMREAMDLCEEAIVENEDAIVENEEPIGVNDVSIVEVWTENYTNYETEVEKITTDCNDVNVEVTDCLFSVMPTEPLVTQVESVIMSHCQ